MITNIISQRKIQSIHRRFRQLYGDQADRLTERFVRMIGRYGVGATPVSAPTARWDQKDVALITYGDMVQKEGERPLVSLKRFSAKYLKGAVQTVHILPFYPWTSDDGFSVVDYREVGKEFGKWQDITSLGEDFDLAFDLVLNHCSRSSPWFEDYLLGVSPGRQYFLEMDPKTDLSAVVRPRVSPLLSKAVTRNGETWVWTTFSEDQVDLNWQNPDLLFEFIDILFLYISMGVRILRLDAVAFLWKRLGTSCLHLHETHEMVKLFRDIIETVAPHVIILTETNVPHEENISYFGKNDEAHMVYNFSLPPLLLHGLLTNNSAYLTDWAQNLVYPAKSCTYFNFSASHDGIGVRPIQGILPDNELKKVTDAVIERGGQISYKKNSDGTESPYELNITYASALSVPADVEKGLHRFFCSQAVVLALKGVPAVYFHSLMATQNYTEGVERTGRARTINRRKWSEQELDNLLNDPEQPQSGFFSRLVQLMRRRANYPAFHPDGRQVIYDFGPEFFALERISPLGNQEVFCVFNFTGLPQTLNGKTKCEFLQSSKRFYDIVSGKMISQTKKGIVMQPYQALWLVPR